MCSGDTDGRIPVTSTKNSINTMKLPIKTPWHAWYLYGEVNFQIKYYAFFNLISSGVKCL